MKEYGAAAARVSEAAHNYTAEYQQCEYTSDRRCEYPGTQKANRNGKWMCSAHHGCFDPILGADIVQESIGYARRWAEKRDEHRRRRQEEAERWCRENGLDTVDKMREYVRGGLRQLVQRNP